MAAGVEPVVSGMEPISATWAEGWDGDDTKAAVAAVEAWADTAAVAAAGAGANPAQMWLGDGEATEA